MPLSEAPSGPTDNDNYVDAVHDRGLRFDLGTLSRRRALALFGSAGLVGLAGCATGTGISGAPTPGSGTTTEVASPATAGATAVGGNATAARASGTATTECVAEVPDETAGPFPGDGSNGANALTTSGVVRNDIRSSFAGATGIAVGVPLTLRLTVLADACKPMAGAAVYVWHCDREGGYSMYSAAVRHENYLRGVAATDAAGTVEFTSIFPGCYAGRWPHIHFQVFESLGAATSGRREIVKTSQIAFPEDACRAAYAADGYDTSVSNLSRTSLRADGIFRDDGGARQMATMSGSNARWTAALTVTVN
ncbi:3,4-dioxygenase subunit beta [Granulicoccus sp. GXG6511]|uniref:dioxygenase family protein n=1 Tax=Granulicoccus sp. GXG6511 TaxID=3381351 RepID=UPI003D7F116B